MVMSNNYPSNYDKWHGDLLKLKNYCSKMGVPIVFVTSMPNDELARLTKDSIAIVKCDATIIKTAARVNATYFVMDQATILKKNSYEDVDKLMAALK